MPRHDIGRVGRPQGPPPQGPSPQVPPPDKASAYRERIRQNRAQEEARHQATLASPRRQLTSSEVATVARQIDEDDRGIPSLRGPGLPESMVAQQDITRVAAQQPPQSAAYYEQLLDQGPWAAAGVPQVRLGAPPAPGVTTTGVLREDLPLPTELWRTVKRFGGQVVGGVGGTLQTIGQLEGPADRAHPEPSLTIQTPLADFDPLKGLGRTLSQKGEEIIEANPPSLSVQAAGAFNPSNPRWWVARGGEGFLQLASQVAFALALPGGAALKVARFALPSVVLEGGGSFPETERLALAAGASPEEAERTAAGSAAIIGATSAVLEAIPAAALVLQRVPGADQVFQRALTQRVATFLRRSPPGVPSAVAEGLTEAAQEASAAVIQFAQTNNPEALHDIAGRMAAGATLGAVLGGTVGLASTSQQRRAVSKSRILEAIATELAQPSALDQVARATGGLPLSRAAQEQVLRPPEVRELAPDPRSTFERQGGRELDLPPTIGPEVRLDDSGLPIAPEPTTVPGPVIQPEPTGLPAPTEVARAVDEAAAPLGGPTTPSRYIKIPDEKVAKNMGLLTTRRAKSAATGKPMPGNPNNPRTVIRAEPGSGNPDVVVGNITQEDWIQRTESLLNPAEIAESARWYEDVIPTFEQASGGDLEVTKRLVAAWLSAQQNQSPENALKQVLRVREHILRGVPVEDLPAAGLPAVTRAVHAILTGGYASEVGPKISDFFDSAEGRSVRTWMGLDPGGGAPFVIDIHSARDTGLVDERLVSILKRRGYDSEALDALKIEKPAGAKYENRAEWGRRLTSDLNARNWMGRSDWKPSEIQAVGWAAMRKITAESDVQGILDVIEQSTRRPAFEVLPGENSDWDKRFGARLRALSAEELATVTRLIGEDALRLAARETGVEDLAAVVHSLGGWEGAVTPNIVGRFLASSEAMDAITARLGYYLDQTEVLGSTLRPDIKKPKAYAVDFLEVGTSTLRNDADLEQFWKVIQDADDTGTFKGFSPVEYADGSSGVRVVFDLSYGSKDIGGLGANKLRASLAPGGAIHKALEGLDLGVDVEIETRLFQTELSRSVNNFKEVPDGASHLQRIADITGRGPTNTDLLNRKELTRSLEEALGAAEGRAGDLRFEESDAFRARRIALRDRRVSGAGATGRVFSRGVGRTRSSVLGETLHTFTPSTEEVSALASVRVSTPEIIETASGDAFHRAIVAASDAHPQGSAVDKYSPEKFAGMRLFMTEDGTAGFALKGDEIVSVFKHPESPYNHWGIYALRLATEQGGKRLDAFDPVLPKLYAAAGFQPTGRTGFVDEFAPEGWNFETQGRPDVVAMVYDAPSSGRYIPDSGARFSGADAYNEMLADAATRVEGVAGTPLLPSDPAAPRRAEVDDPAYVPIRPAEPPEESSSKGGFFDLAGTARGARGILRRWFTTAGDLPKRVFRLKVERDGKISSQQTQVGYILADFRRAAKEAFGSKPSEEQLRAIDDVLKGELKPETLPEVLRPVVKKMRDELDTLSRALIDAGVVEGDLVAKVTDNLGSYTTRSYRVFDDPTWANRVPKEVRNKAKAWLKGEFPLKSLDEIEGLIASLLYRIEDGPIALLSKGGKLGSKDLSMLAKRKDIAPEIRALWGEYHDPGVNFARSAIKMGNVIANHIFLTEVANSGRGEVSSGRNIMGGLIDNLQRKDYRSLGYTKKLLKTVRSVEAGEARLAVARLTSARWKDTSEERRAAGQPEPTKPEWAVAADRYLENFDPDFVGQVTSRLAPTPLEGVSLSALLQPGAEGTQSAGYLFDRPRTIDGVEYKAKIAAEGSSVMSPLNGLYTTPEIKRAFEDALDPLEVGPWLRAYMKVNGVVKYSKTVLSLMTHVRNTVGNVGFAVANGHFRVGKAGKAIRVIFNNITAGPNTEFREYYRHLQELGVVDQSAHEGELRAAIRDAGLRDTGEALADPSTSVLRRALNFAGSVYRAEDDVWKIYAFENERIRYQDAYPGKSAAEIEQKAARIVRDTYPTYSNIPRAIRHIRRAPIIGAFVSFPAEVVRVGYHTINLAQQELRDPATRSIGAQRLAGIIAASTAVPAVAAASRFLTGMTDDDEEDMRRFMPSWSENSDFLHLGTDKDGNRQYVDLSYTDPYSYLRTPVRALLRGEDWVDALYESAKEAFEPFLSEDILFERLSDINRNTRQGGGRVFNPQETPVGLFEAIADHVWGALEPGTISSFRRIEMGISGKTSFCGRSYDPRLEAVSVLTGHRLSTLDLKLAFAFRAGDYGRDIRDSQQLLTRVARQRSKTTEADLERAISAMTYRRNSVFQNAHEDALAARRLGMTPRALKISLTKGGQGCASSAGMSEANADAIISGDITRYIMSPTILESTEERVRAENAILPGGGAGGLTLSERARYLHRQGVGPPPSTYDLIRPRN